MASFFHTMLARIHGFFRRDALDRDFDEELATHLAMAEDDKLRQGMSRQEARRRARVELGGLTQLREAGREARGLPWLDTFALDVKLGLRMLRKSWGLTLIGGLAMTVAIGIGAVVFAFFDTVFRGHLPLEDGDRVIAIQTWDEKEHLRRRTALADFDRWHEQLRRVEDFGAFQTARRNLLVVDDPRGGDQGSSGKGEPVAVAEMTASGFALARVPPLLGRPIVEQDEHGAADPVVVIGYDVWQSRFLADPEVLGRRIRLGETVHTVVGVMPEGFAFPVNHRLWTPLQTDRIRAEAFQPDLGAQRDSGAPHEVEVAGPTLGDGEGFGVVFARLAPGATIEGAQAELTALGLVPSVREPEIQESLEPRLVPYTFAFTGDFERAEVRWIVRIVLFVVVLLLVPPCANIAILVYARTVTRQEEFAARYVLGASRLRIVGQLFVEMLVLAAVGAAGALAAARLALRFVQGANSRNLMDAAPFWIDFSLSFRTVLFAAALAVVAATIAGVVPALKATGRQMQAGLRSLGSRTGMKLGATWTALVVIQIALSLAALPSAVELGWGTLRTHVLGPGFPAEEYLTARLALDDEERFAALETELVRQLDAEPGITAVTVAAAVPGDEPWKTVEVEGLALPEGIFAGYDLVQVNRVDDAFFGVFEIPLLSGRGFDAGDFESTSTMIVDRTFVEMLPGDTPTNPLGRRVRFLESTDTAAAAATPRWYEIVGVVADCPSNATQGTVYLPRGPGELRSASVALRVATTHVSAAERLREITAALDPSLRVDAILPLDEIYRQQAIGNNIGASVLAVVTLAVLLLSAAGIYALMSFTINRRRHEIGIRSALGAPPSRLLAGVFRRSLGQLALGAAGGLSVALALDFYLPIELVGGWDVPGIVPAAVGIMTMVGLLATLGPARRALRVEPIDELREG